MPKKSAMLICGMKGMAAQHGQSALPPPFGRAPARLPRLLGARQLRLFGAQLAALGGLALPEGKRPRHTRAPPLPRVVESATSKVFLAGSTAFDTFQAEGVKELAGESGVDEKMVIANF